MPDRTQTADTSAGFASFIAGERQRLTNWRASVEIQIADSQKVLDDINREFAAIEAYESAKAGKAARISGAAGGGGRQQRVRRGSRREELVNLIRQNNGLSRADILTLMGLKGDKSGEMSVSNALTALTKRGQVWREGGKYLPAAVPEQHQQQAPRTGTHG